MRSPLVAFALGLLFAAGLAVSGMTQPTKVLGFLNLRGAWDPTLVLVLIGAIVVTAVSFPFVLRRTRPLLEPSFALPQLTQIDARLVSGAAIFGVGWGISGLCPGPALVALAKLNSGTLAFFAAMTASALATRAIEAARAPVLDSEVD